MSSVQSFPKSAVKLSSWRSIPITLVVPLVAGIDVLSFVTSIEVLRRFCAGPHSDPRAYLGLALLAGLAFWVCGRSWGVYRLQCLIAPRRYIRWLALASGAGFATIVSVLFLLKTGAEFSRTVVGLFAITSLFVIFVERGIIAHALSRAFELELVRGKRVVLVGDSSELDRLTAKDILHFGLEEIGRFTLSLPGGVDELAPRDAAVVTQALQFGRRHNVAEYAVVMPWSRDLALTQVVNLL